MRKKADHEKKKRPKQVATQPSPIARLGDYKALKRHAPVILALWVVTLIVYSNSFRTGFVFDSYWLILRDSRITAATAQNVNLIFNKEYWYGTSITGLYRPFSTLSYLFNYAVLGSGSNPAGYHWLNFGLHAVNVSLLYLLGLFLLEETTLSFAMAAIWAVHPINTESVTNIVGRPDLLAAFAVLGGLLCHIRAAESPGRRKWFWLGTLMLVVTVGLFSKESAVGVLAGMLIYDFAFRSGSWSASALGYLALTPPFAIYFYFREQVLAKSPVTHITFTQNPLIGADFWSGRLTAIKVVGKYLWLLVWPQHLASDYSYNQIPLSTLADWQTAIALVVCCGVIGIAVYCYRCASPVFFFIAFFFAALAPTSNLLLVIGTIMAERFLYLPAIAFAGCLVMAVEVAFRRMGGRRAVASALAVLFVALATRTYLRNGDWLDARTLWTSAVNTSPASFKTHINLGSTLIQPNGAGLDSAIGETDRALAILDSLSDKQNDPTAYTKAGQLYCRKGDTLASTPQGAEWYRKSLAALLRAQRIGSAMNQENRRIDLAHGERTSEMDWSDIYQSLAITYLRLSDSGHAEEALLKSRVKWPQQEFFEEMSSSYRAVGDMRQSAITLVEGLVVNTTYTKLASELLELYKQIDPQGCAVRNGGLNLQCPLVHDHVCTASLDVYRRFLRGNQVSAAEQTRRSAVGDMACPAEPFN